MEETYRDYTTLQTLSESSKKSTHLAKLNNEHLSLPQLFILKHYKSPVEPYSCQIHKMLSQANSNILKLYSFWQDPSGFYVCIEYCEKRNLKHFITKNYSGPSKFPEVLENCMQLTLNLNTMHNLGITHNNISCSKVLISSNKNMKLSSFSSAIHHRNIKLFNCKNLSSPSYSRKFGEKHPEFVPFIQDIKSLGKVFVEIATSTLCPELGREVSDKDTKKLEMSFEFFRYSAEFSQLVIQMLKVESYSRCFLQKVIDDLRKIYSNYEGEIFEDSEREKFKVDPNNRTLRLLDEESADRHLNSSEQEVDSLSSSRIYSNADVEEESYAQSRRSSFVSKKSERNSLESKTSKRTSLESKNSERSSLVSKSERNSVDRGENESYKKIKPTSKEKTTSSDNSEILLNPNETNNLNVESVNKSSQSNIFLQNSFGISAPKPKINKELANKCSICEKRDNLIMFKLTCGHFLHRSCMKSEMEIPLLNNQKKKIVPFRCNERGCNKSIGFEFFSEKDFDAKAKKISLMQLCASLPFYCNDCKKYNEGEYLLSDKLERLNLFCKGCKRTHCNFCGARGGHRFFCDLFRDFIRGNPNLEKYRKYF